MKNEKNAANGFGMLIQRMKTLPIRVRAWWNREEDGVGTVEVVLLLVVIIALVVLFREQITGILDDVFDGIQDTVDTF